MQRPTEVKPQAPFARARMQTNNTQVLFADLQPGLVAASITTSTAMISTAAEALAAGADILGLPMTFSVVHESGKQGRVIPELARYSTPENTFDRTSASPLLDGPTADALARNGRRFLIVAGFSAEVVVLHAVLDALEAGYEVHVPVDTVGSRSARTESAVLRQMDRAGAVTTSIHTVLTRLEPDLSQPPGSAVMTALKGLREAAQKAAERTGSQFDN
jgi:hypothetical protein